MLIDEENRRKEIKKKSKEMTIANEKPFSF